MLVNSWRAPCKLSGCFWYWKLSFRVIETSFLHICGSIYDCPILFFVEDQLFELQTVEDLAIIFEEGNFLKDDEERNVFRKALEIIGRINLAKKFEIFVAAGKSY